jgi:hypothetical protein
MDCDPIVTSTERAPDAPVATSWAPPVLVSSHGELVHGRAEDGRLPDPGEVPAMGWLMVVWSVVTAALVVWLADAEDLVHRPWGWEDDPTRCACCRHDLIAHEHGDAASGCSQCPCPAFRPPG